MNIDNGQERRREILGFMIDYVTEHGYVPSIREIGKGVGLSSTSTVHHHMQILLERGYIETDENDGRFARAYRVRGTKVIVS